MSKVHGPYVAALDGLRGVAIAGVLLFHTGNLAGGFLGVDLFFALSGYLITGLLLREIDETGGVSLRSFWGRRTRRLMPALALMLGSVTVLVWARAPADLVRSTLADGPWVQANLVNWHLLADSAGYWDRFGAARVFAHLWSIAVEEQFYLVWPVIVWFVARWGRRADRWVAAVALVVSVVSVALMAGLVDPADPTRVYTGTDTRAFSLLIGALAATAPVRVRLGRLVAGRWAGAATLVVVAGIATMWALADGTASAWLFTGGLFAHSVASAALIGLCVHRPASVLSRILGAWPLRWLGQLSYSLYLWHWPVIVLLSSDRTGLGGWWWTGLVCVVSVALAVLSKHLVEDPIRFRARWARGRRGVLVFVAVTALLALLWTALPGPPAPIVDVADLD
jgi:peptidoglycan/LPS O-acetylase OafA/YrhL